MSSNILRPLWSRVITGDGMRKTRFHTYSGDLIDWKGFFNLPRSIWSVILLKGVGYHQRAPWLGYRVVRRLSKLVHPHWDVLEFGSGMSSLFLASRCSRLVSVESAPAWFDRMRRLFASRAIANVDYRLRRAEEYTRLEDLP